jgi:hypothetical protein
MKSEIRSPERIAFLSRIIIPAVFSALEFFPSVTCTELQFFRKHEPLAKPLDNFSALAGVFGRIITPCIRNEKGSGAKFKFRPDFAGE